jgi:hypothetical protein
MQEDGGRKMDAEVETIKREHFEAIKSRDVVLIVKADYGWQIERWSPDGVSPTSDYDTPHEAAARACQLLKLTEPVIPQDWPEVAQIGGPASPPPRPR